MRWLQILDPADESITSRLDGPNLVQCAPTTYYVVKLPDPA